MRQYNSKYLFFTDAGTTHDQFCIPRLVNYMERRPNIASVTGFECTQVCRSIQYLRLKVHLDCHTYLYLLYLETD